MFGIKFTALLLITAIFNPLCCCLDLSAKNASPAPQAEHSCCANEADTNNSETERHTRTDCPHQSEKNSQISETPSTHDSLVKSQISHTAILYALEMLPRNIEREASLLPLPSSTSSPPPIAVLEKYCVYIL